MHFFTILALATAALAAPVTDSPIEARSTCKVHGGYSVVGGTPAWTVKYTNGSGKAGKLHDIKNKSLTTSGDLPKPITATKKSGTSAADPIIGFSYNGQRFDNTAAGCKTGKPDASGDIQFDCDFTC